MRTRITFEDDSTTTTSTVPTNTTTTAPTPGPSGSGAGAKRPRQPPDPEEAQSSDDEPMVIPTPQRIIRTHSHPAYDPASPIMCRAIREKVFGRTIRQRFRVQRNNVFVEPTASDFDNTTAGRKLAEAMERFERAEDEWEDEVQWALEWHREQGTLQNILQDPSMVELPRRNPAAPTRPPIAPISPNNGHPVVTTTATTGTTTTTGTATTIRAHEQPRSPSLSPLPVPNEAMEDPFVVYYDWDDLEEDRGEQAGLEGTVATAARVGARIIETIVDGATSVAHDLARQQPRGRQDPRRRPGEHSHPQTTTNQARRLARVEIMMAFMILCWLLRAVTAEKAN